MIRTFWSNHALQSPRLPSLIPLVVLASDGPGKLLSALFPALLIRGWRDSMLSYIFLLVVVEEIDGFLFEVPRLIVLDNHANVFAPRSGRLAELQWQPPFPLLPGQSPNGLMSLIAYLHCNRYGCHLKRCSFTRS